MLSIIVPVLNESESLRALHAEIDAASHTAGIGLEVIFVDDGSTDDSWRIVEELSRTDERVSGIRFRRNFGKAAALSAGFKQATGDLLLMMDADLQDDPGEIPRMLERIEQGADVVNGWKRRRLDPWHKVYPSKVFNWMVSRLTGVWLHDHNCGLKCFRKEVAGEIRLYGELHRFIPVLAASRGFKVSELEVNHRPRKFGHSKYGFRRFLRGFLDLMTVKFLTAFSQRPQHVLGALGLLFFALGGAGLAFLAAWWVLMNLTSLGLNHEPIGVRPLLTYSMTSLLLGGQLLSLGFLAELLVHYAGNEVQMYSVAGRTNRQSEGSVS